MTTLYLSEKEIKHFKVSPMQGICGCHGIRKLFTENQDEVNCKSCLKIMNLGSKDQRRKDEYILRRSKRSES